MSDVMLKGVLRMPRHMAMGDAISSAQFYDRAQEALDRMERAEAALEEILSIEPMSPEGGHEAVAEIHRVARAARGC